ncbi:MAG: glycosyltransferase [Syntrophobacterales bacterium]|nr:glycosyltransferase [Syntrophobacterales bacterium]
MPKTSPLPEPDVTVLVVTYNRAGMLRQALASLLQQETRGEFRYEILVIDDGSTDHTPRVVADIQAQAGGVPVRSVRQENRGMSAARNQGIRLAEGEWVALFDDDERAAPGWLHELWRTARETGALVVGGRVVVALPPEMEAGLGPRARRVLGETPPRVSSSPSPDELTGGNVLLHRDLLRRLGGFAAFLRRDQDTDFFWRVRRAGLSLAYAPHALTCHVLPPHRWQEAALRRINLMQGVADAGFLLKFGGGPRLLLALARRLAVVLFRDLPGLLFSWLAGDRTLGLESRLGLWYAQGLGRGALFWALPRLFPQTRFIREAGIFFPQPGEDHLSLRGKFLGISPHG